MAAKETDDDRLDRFRRDVTRDTDAMYEQSIEANEDIRFVRVRGAMWEDERFDSFQERCQLEFDTVSPQINRFRAEWNQNRIGVEYKPDDTATTDDDAELLNGIWRADYRQNSGRQALFQAIDEVSMCGYGCMKLLTQFEDEGDPENDLQRIHFQPIYNAYQTIFWDRAALRADKKDARWCVELVPFIRDTFEEKWPDKSVVTAFTPESRFFKETLRGSTETIYVAVRYEIVHKKETVYIYKNLRTETVQVFSEKDHELVKDELKEDELITFVRKRDKTIQFIEKTVFSGEDILEPTKRIAGKWIPIIPFYGYRTYIDGSEWYYGMVSKNKDPARVMNMQFSQLAENAMSLGQEVPVFEEERIRGYENDWADRNNKAYLLLRKGTDADGNKISEPIEYLKPPQLDASTQALMTLVPAFLEQSTGGIPQEVQNNDMSGKLFNAQVKRQDMNTQVISDNIESSIEFSGTVYQDMAADGIYTVERMLRVVGKDGQESSKAMMSVVFDEESGTTVQANNLQGKKFRAYADIGPQYATQREETVEQFKAMLEVSANVPGLEEFVPLMITGIMDNISGVGLDAIKKKSREMQILQGSIEPETDEEIALVQQAQQQTDPQQELVRAAAMQQEAEARNLDAKTLDNSTHADKNVAETQQILSETEIVENEATADIAHSHETADNERIKTLSQARKAAIESVQRTPLQ